MDYTDILNAINNNVSNVNNNLNSVFNNITNVNNNLNSVYNSLNSVNTKLNTLNTNNVDVLKALNSIIDYNHLHEIQYNFMICLLTLLVAVIFFLLISNTWRR